MKAATAQTLLAMLVVAFGCAQNRAESRTAASDADIASSRIELSISTEHAVYLPAERIILSGTLRNNSLVAVTVTESNPFAEYELTVTYANGSPVPLTVWGKAAVQASGNVTRIFESSLAPGQAKALRFVLNRIYDMSDAGDYRVTAKRWIGDADARHKQVASHVLDIHVADELP